MLIALAAAAALMALTLVVAAVAARRRPSLPRPPIATTASNLPGRPADVAGRCGRVAPRRTRLLVPYLGPPGVAGWLVSLNGASPFTTSVIDRAGDTTIGADPGCGVVVDDPLVSGVHAVIAGRSGYFKLIDWDSRNGTFVAGTRVAGEQALTDGARIQVGSTIFEWVTITPDAEDSP